MINNFVTIDFETSYGHIPCSIGIVEFSGGKVINQYYSLIKPIDLKFSAINSSINGIYLDDVIKEREFDCIWKEISHYIHGKLVVAHNSSTDLAILKKTLEFYRIEQPIFESLCTLTISKKIIALENYRLSTLARHYNIKQENYHNALDDALICGYLFLIIYEPYSKNIFIEEVIDQKKIKPYHQGVSKVTLSLDLIKKDVLVQSEKLNGITFVISGIFENFARDELRELIEGHGGKILSSVSTKLNFLVAGDNMGPSKLEKAIKLNIKLISEYELLKMIES